MCKYHFRIWVLEIFLISYHLLSCPNAGNDYSMLGTVDSYGHLIVSKLDTTGEGTISNLVLICGSTLVVGIWEYMLLKREK